MESNCADDGLATGEVQCREQRLPGGVPPGGEVLAGRAGRLGDYAVVVAARGTIRVTTMSSQIRAALVISTRGPAPAEPPSCRSQPAHFGLTVGACPTSQREGCKAVPPGSPTAKARATDWPATRHRGPQSQPSMCDFARDVGMGDW